MSNGLPLRNGTVLLLPRVDASDNFTITTPSGEEITWGEQQRRRETEAHKRREREDAAWRADQDERLRREKQARAERRAARTEVKVAIKVPIALHRKLKAAAEQSRKSMSEMTVTLVRSGMRHRKMKPKDQRRDECQ